MEQEELLAVQEDASKKSQSKVAKKLKLKQIPVTDTTTMLIKFIPTNAEDSQTNPNHHTIDLPLSATTIQMEACVNALVKANPTDDNVPFAFYLETAQDKFAELTGSLLDAVQEHKLGTETTLQIRYQPLALFKVRPVTRLTDSLSGHEEAILHVQFSPNGDSLASGGGDATVRFWDVQTMTPRFVCKGHKNHVLCTSWSQDGLKFASGDRNGEIRLWNPQSGTSMAVCAGHKKWITSLSWEPLHVRKDVQHGRLLSGSKDSTARIWNTETGRCEATLTSHSDSIECVLWGGEGLVYTASRDRTITCWFEEDGAFKIARVLTGHAHRVNSLAISNAHIIRTGMYDCEEEVVLANRERRGKSTASSAVLTSKERYDKKKKMQGDGEFPFERLVSCSDDYTLFLWYPTLHKRPILRMTGHVQPVTHLCFSPDGRFLVSASFDKKIKLWDGRTGKFLHTCQGHVGRVYQVSWSPDSRLFASASADSTIKVWEARNPERAKHTLSGHYDEVYALDWSPNGEILASGSKDRLVKVWRS